jgi:RecA-family ATPase
MAPLAKRNSIPPDDAIAAGAVIFRQAAWEHGFRPIPVRTREKKPFGVAWQAAARGDPPACAAPGAVALPAALSTGILCDGLRVIDVDVDDPKLAELVAGLAFDILGDAPIRFRADSSRILIVYAAAAGEPGKRSVKGELGSVEVLGRGQQFVADGTHPGGQPYQWRIGSPADTRRGNLVAVTEDSIASFLDVVGGLLQSAGEKAGCQRVEEASREEAPLSAAGRPDLASHPLVRAWAQGALRSAVEALASCTDGGRNNKLNDSALGLGEVVGGGWLLEAEVRAALEEACHRNGYTSSDGIHAVRATISSGLTAGIKRPRALPESILAKIAGHDTGLPPHNPETGEVVEDKDADVLDETGKAQAAARRSVLATICAADFAGTPVPCREWLSEELIPARTVTLLGGDGGVGKSLVALQLAVAVSLGVPWLGMDVQHGAVLFLTAEDDLDEVHRRLDDVVRALPRPLAHLHRLFVSSLAGEDALLATQDGRNNKIIKATPLFEALKARVDELKPVLVILDTLADLFGGEENDRAQARQFISLLRGLAMKLGTTVVLLSHPSVSGMASGSGTSGSTAWNNSVRSRLYLDRVREDRRVVDPDARILEVMKANYGKTGNRIALRWKRGIFVRDGSVDADTGESLAANSERVFVELVVAYERQGRSVSHKSSNAYAPALFAREERAKGLTKRELATAMNRLLDRGVIKIIVEGPNSRQRNRIVIADISAEGASEAKDEEL